ncbi:MAG: MFS transporter [Thermoleophilaceae bacterium]|nr:MFS transporter [Thermoleophilaceae bacterium]
MTPDLTPDVARAHPSRTLGILVLGAIAYALAQTMIVPALPAIQHGVGASQEAVTWMLTAFLLTSSVCTPIVGRLGDMYGKEKLLLIALGVFAVGSLVCALGNSIGVLILGRAIQGAGGAIFPLAFGIIRDEFPPERVATSIGLISATFGIGGGLGLVLAGVMVDHLSVHWIFWSSLATTVVAAWATWRYVPESPVRVKASIDYGGAVLLSLALTSLLLGVSQGNSWGWGSAGVLGLFAAAVAFAFAFVAYERRVAEPMVDIRLMQQRPVWSTNLTAFAIGFAMFGSYILIPQLVELPEVTGYGFSRSTTVAGLIMLPSALVMLGAGPLSGWLGSRFGSRLPLAIGGVFAGLAYVSLALFHATLFEIAVGAVLIGIGIGLAFAAMANLIVEAVRQDQTGVATGINTIMRSIGGSIGAQVVASILAADTILGGRFPAEDGFTAAFTMSAAAAVVALIATALIPPGGRRERMPVPLGAKA